MDEAWTGCVMDYALASTEGNDVIFLGDSICRSGIEPIQFEHETRLRGYKAQSKKKIATTTAVAVHISAPRTGARR